MTRHGNILRAAWRLLLSARKSHSATLLSEETKADVVLPFRRLSLEEVRPFENCVPLYDLKVAAGKFSDEKQITELYEGLSGQDQISDNEWVELPERLPPPTWPFCRSGRWPVDEPTDTKWGVVSLPAETCWDEAGEGCPCTTQRYYQYRFRRALHSQSLREQNERGTSRRYLGRYVSIISQA